MSKPKQILSKTQLQVLFRHTFSSNLATQRKPTHNIFYLDAGWCRYQELADEQRMGIQLAVASGALSVDEALVLASQYIEATAAPTGGDS